MQQWSPRSMISVENSFAFIHCHALSTCPCVLLHLFIVSKREPHKPILLTVLPWMRRCVVSVVCGGRVTVLLFWCIFLHYLLNLPTSLSPILNILDVFYVFFFHLFMFTTSLLLFFSMLINVKCILKIILKALCNYVLLINLFMKSSIFLSLFLVFTLFSILTLLSVIHCLSINYPFSTSFCLSIPSYFGW